MSIMTEKTEVIGTLVVVNESGERRKEGSDERRAKERASSLCLHFLVRRQRARPGTSDLHAYAATTDGRHVTQVAERGKDTTTYIDSALNFSVAMKCAVIFRPVQ